VQSSPQNQNNLALKLQLNVKNKKGTTYSVGLVYTWCKFIYWRKVYLQQNAVNTPGQQFFLQRKTASKALMNF